MPELPHVAAFKRYTDATAIGRTVQHTHVHDDRVLDGISRGSLVNRLTGHRLAKARRHGKYLGIAIDESSRQGPHLLLHFAMSGDLERYDDASDEPEYAVLTLDLDDGGHLAFTCKRMLCRVGFTDSFERFVDEENMGPDALDNDLTRDWFRDALGERRGTIKNALMDQSLMAGIGNEFADEILFHVGLDPETTVTALGSRRIEGLFDELRSILAEAAGRDWRLDEPPDDWLLTRRSEGDPCPRCGGSIAKKTVAGRSTYYCPSCQDANGEER